MYLALICISSITNMADSFFIYLITSIFRLLVFVSGRVQLEITNSTLPVLRRKSFDKGNQLLPGSLEELKGQDPRGASKNGSENSAPEAVPLVSCYFCPSQLHSRCGAAAATVVEPEPCLVC